MKDVLYRMLADVLSVHEVSPGHYVAELPSGDDDAWVPVAQITSGDAANLLVSFTDKVLVEVVKYLASEDQASIIFELEKILAAICFQLAPIEVTLPVTLTGTVATGSALYYVLSGDLDVARVRWNMASCEN